MKVPIEHAAVEASTTVEALVRAIDEGTIEGWRFVREIYVDTNATANLDLPVASWWRINDFAEHWSTSYDMARRRLLTTPHVNVLDTYYYPAPTH